MATLAELYEQVKQKAESAYGRPILDEKGVSMYDLAKLEDADAPDDILSKAGYRSLNWMKGSWANTPAAKDFGGDLKKMAEFNSPGGKWINDPNFGEVYQMNPGVAQQDFGHGQDDDWMADLVLKGILAVGTAGMGGMLPGQTGSIFSAFGAPATGVAEGGLGNLVNATSEFGGSLATGATGAGTAANAAVAGGLAPEFADVAMEVAPEAAGNGIINSADAVWPANARPELGARQAIEGSAQTIFDPAYEAAAAASGVSDSWGWLDATKTWVKDNPMFASTGLNLAGGLIKGALAPTPEEQAKALADAKVRSELELAAARRANNNLTGLNVSRLKPSGRRLTRPGIINGGVLG